MSDSGMKHTYKFHGLVINSSENKSLRYAIIQ